MKNVLITGASGGIGSAAARAFARAGWNIALHYHHSKEAALALKEELHAEYGITAAALQADLCSAEQTAAMVEEAQAELGFLSALVNNAGVAQQKLFTDITDGDWDTMIGIHLGGTFRCCRAVLPEMIRRRHGTILNISSMWGQIGGSCEVHYSAAKAGVIGLTKALAKEVGLSGVTVNCVAPGVIRTAMLDGFTEEDLASLAEETPVGRLGTPEDVADLLVFLAGDSARFITGQVIGVNGGFVV